MAPKASTSSSVVDKGPGGRFQTVTTRTPNATGGMDVQQKTFTIREPEQNDSNPSTPSGSNPILNREPSLEAVNSNIVELLFLLLILVNSFTSGQFKGLWGLITLQNTSNPPQFRQGFMVLFGELVALVLLSIVAKSSDTGRKISLFFVGALWLGWFMHNQQVISNFTAKVQPGKTVKQGGKLTTA